MPPGSSEPSFAIGTISPSLILSAPVTICIVSSPTFTCVTTNLSASGCLSILRIFPTTTFLISFPFSSIPSTFEPVIVRISPSSFELTFISLYSFNHSILAFIIFLLYCFWNLVFGSWYCMKHLYSNFQIQNTKHKIAHLNFIRTVL